MNIIWFTGRQAHKPALVGGKGANLGRLNSAGFPVPQGFTVRTAAYRAFITARRLDAVSSIARQDLDYAVAAAVSETASPIRAAPSPAHYPLALARDIDAAYARLGACDTR